MSSSRRKAIALTLGWWLLRRRLSKGAASAALGLLAGEVLPAPRKRHRLRNLLLLGALVAAAFVVWRRLRGGDADGWGTWEPEQPPTAPVAFDTSAPPAAS